MLIPCEGCKRHVRAADDRCPFCGAAITAVPVARSMFEGRLSRAAVFASAVLIAPGCLVQSNPPPNYQQQLPPPPPAPPPDDPQGHHTEFSQPPPDQDPRPAPTGRVHGRVLDTNGTPQVRTLVELVAGAQRFQAITGEDGRYSIVGVPAGQYTIVVGGTRNRVIETAAGEDRIVDVGISAPPERIRPYDRSNIPKPYGAPPARKRVV
jgi:hypothetical protein